MSTMAQVNQKSEDWDSGVLQHGRLRGDLPELDKVSGKAISAFEKGEDFDAVKAIRDIVDENRKVALEAAFGDIDSKFADHKRFLKMRYLRAKEQAGGVSNADKVRIFQDAFYSTYGKNLLEMKVKPNELSEESIAILKRVLKDGYDENNVPPELLTVLMGEAENSDNSDDLGKLKTDFNNIKSINDKVSPLIEKLRGEVNFFDPEKKRERFVELLKKSEMRDEFKAKTDISEGKIDLYKDTLVDSQEYVKNNSTQLKVALGDDFAILEELISFDFNLKDNSGQAFNEFEETYSPFLKKLHGFIKRNEGKLLGDKKDDELSNVKKFISNINFLISQGKDTRKHVPSYLDTSKKINNTDHLTEFFQKYIEEFKGGLVENLQKANKVIEIFPNGDSKNKPKVLYDELNTDIDALSDDPNLTPASNRFSALMEKMEKIERKYNELVDKIEEVHVANLSDADEKEVQLEAAKLKGQKSLDVNELIKKAFKDNKAEVIRKEEEITRLEGAKAYFKSNDFKLLPEKQSEYMDLLSSLEGIGVIDVGNKIDLRAIKNKSLSTVKSELESARDILSPHAKNSTKNPEASAKVHSALEIINKLINLSKVLNSSLNQFNDYRDLVDGVIGVSEKENVEKGDNSYRSLGRLAMFIDKTEYQTDRFKNLSESSDVPSSTLKFYKDLNYLITKTKESDSIEILVKFERKIEDEKRQLDSLNSSLKNLRNLTPDQAAFRIVEQMVKERYKDLNPAEVKVRANNILQSRIALQNSLDTDQQRAMKANAEELQVADEMAIKNKLLDMEFEVDGKKIKMFRGKPEAYMSWVKIEGLIKNNTISMVSKNGMPGNGFFLLAFLKSNYGEDNLLYVRTEQALKNKFFTHILGKNGMMNLNKSAVRAKLEGFFKEGMDKAEHGYGQWDSHVNEHRGGWDSNKQALLTAKAELFQKRYMQAKNVDDKDQMSVIEDEFKMFKKENPDFTGNITLTNYKQSDIYKRSVEIAKRIATGSGEAFLHALWGGVVKPSTFVATRPIKYSFMALNSFANLFRHKKRPSEYKRAAKEDVGKSFNYAKDKTKSGLSKIQAIAKARADKVKASMEEFNKGLEDDIGKLKEKVDYLEKKDTGAKPVEGDAAEFTFDMDEMKAEVKELLNPTTEPKAA